jgi:DNA-binding transcriptional regulator of glucitol operon
MSSTEAGRQAAERAPAVSWRFLVTPRWLGWHLAMVVSVAGMLALGWWQLRRAEEGNALSWAYTFEWPVFAVFAVVFWAKTIRDEFSPPQVSPAADESDPIAGAGPAGSAGRVDDQEADQAVPGDEDLAAYNAYLARLQEQVKNHGRWHGLR